MVEIVFWVDIDVDLFCFVLMGIFNMVFKFLICIFLYLF